MGNKVPGVATNEDPVLTIRAPELTSGKTDARFESIIRVRTSPPDTDSGHHKIRKVLNVTKPGVANNEGTVPTIRDSCMPRPVPGPVPPRTSASIDARFQSCIPTASADIDSGYHKLRKVLNVTKPFDQTLFEQIGGEEDSSLRLYHELYSYATQGKIDGFKGTIEGKLGSDEVHQSNARVSLLSGLSPYRNTLLHIAASFGHAELAAEILQHHKLLLFETNFDRDTALHTAAKAGDLDTTNTLLCEARRVDSGVSRLLNSINNEKNTPLHEALIHGHESVAKCLIEAHPDLRFDCNKERKSSLYLAAEGGYVEIVKLLKERADKQKTRVPGKSPLHGAILGRRNRGAVELLKIIWSLVEIFESAKDEEEGPKDEKESPKNEKQILIDEEEESPKDEKKESLKNEIQILIDEKKESPKNEKKESPKNEIQILIDEEEDEEESLIDEEEDEEERTPLHCAASTGHLEGVRFLLERRLSDSHQSDHDGNFPIHSASSKGYVNIVKELLQHCPDSKEFRNSKGENILHVAARYGKDNLVKYFLKTAEFQMLINQKDSKGNTPLHLATKTHHPKLVYRLAWDTRTNIQLLNDSGMTALDITESTWETIESYHGRLTWMVLKSAFAKRAQNLHIERKKQRSPQVADNGGDHHGDRYKDRVNALLVVATLVATVAFAAGFTMPGGNNDSAPHKGMALLLTKAMFQAFVICDTIAMYTAILVAVSLIWAQLGDVHLVSTVLHLAVPLLGIALTMMSLAFMAGVYVLVSNLHWLAYVVLILEAIFIISMVVVFIPLSCETTSRFRILRWITYFLFCAEVWASGSHNDDQKED